MMYMDYLVSGDHEKYDGIVQWMRRNFTVRLMSNGETTID